MLVDLPLLLLVFSMGDEGVLLVVPLRQLFLGLAKGKDASWLWVTEDGLGATGCLGKLSSTVRAEVW